MSCKRFGVLFFTLIVTAVLTGCAGLERSSARSSIANDKEPNGAGKIPITTSSEEARKEFLQGRDLNEKLLNQDSIAHFDKAISLDPGHADWYASRAKMLADLKQYRAALADIDVAIRLKSELKALSGLRLFAKMHICDWSGRDADIAQLIEGIERNEPVVNPFILLALSD